MNASKTVFYQGLLMRKLRDLSTAIQLKRAEGITDFDEPEPDVYDVCVQSYSKEQLFSLCERDREVLVEVQEALDKIKRGTFGICEECQELIEEKRLEALPWGGLCIGCQSRKESSVAA
jgi:RNA polymerase-binding transcription factor